MTKLTLIDRALFLKRTPPFTELDLDLLLAISDKLQIMTFDAEEPVFRIDADAYHMYFVVKGSISIRSPDRQLLAILGPGDFFGEESIFSEKPRTYDATAQSKSILLALAKTNLLTILTECPSVAIGFLKGYTLNAQFRPRKRES
jgi:CRP/FNR family cyclic AMP-dependent transcriptional regulator